MTTLAERLTWAREQKGLTQLALAKLAGVSQGSIGNLESGTRSSARRIVDIAAALDVDPTWLANGTGTPPPSFENGSNYAGKTNGEAQPAIKDVTSSETTLERLDAREKHLIEMYRRASKEGQLLIYGAATVASKESVPGFSSTRP